MKISEEIREASRLVSEKVRIKPKIGMILGSGLGDLADEIEPAVRIPYSQIPNFPQTTVEGHKGFLVCGKLEGKPVIAMQGRFHYYEGFSMQELTFPVRVMKALGTEILLVTNACGGIKPELNPGSFMFIRDHINLMGDNPLIGINEEELGPRFPDMSVAYDSELIDLGEKVAGKLEIKTHTGVHTAVTGPYYCSRAELAMVRTIGSDTIGMSTIPETIVAVHSGMKVLGISCVTDMAIPEELEGISHEEVMKVAEQAKPKFVALVRGIIDAIV